MGNWNVSNVERMEHMFPYSRFNRDISSWNVDNVKLCRDFWKSHTYKEGFKIPKFRNCFPHSF
ncbi:BspA family leucine-rich repeat surface protein [uncultured Eudoraea sp.]|uniref:BspA family leucine-rich repeat surface protein n=1 Tax=uncultured Eudoraea sp. TaxID=1035614 RepID=UPI0026109083|nr:BspA family leucine-rich repeat surface protein [uncultured Eudoraea sp.]